MDHALGSGHGDLLSPAGTNQGGPGVPGAALGSTLSGSVSAASKGGPGLRPSSLGSRSTAP